MRDIDEPHHAEDQRQPGGEHGVEPAHQDALKDDVDPFHQRLPQSTAVMPGLVPGSHVFLQLKTKLDVEAAGTNGRA